MSTAAELGRMFGNILGFGIMLYIGYTLGKDIYVNWRLKNERKTE